MRAFAKGGGTGAYSTGLQVIPEKRLVVAASISGRLNGEAVTRPILDGLMKDKGLPVPSARKRKTNGSRDYPAGAYRLRGDLCKRRIIRKDKI